MTARTNWFEGMEVSVFDMTFSSIQATAGELKVRTNDFFTYGVVNGLSVYVDPDGVHAAVSSGVAYDPIGERINVPSNVLHIGYANANLNAVGASYTLIARYVEGNDGVTALSPNGATNYTHVLDSYSILALKNGTDAVGAFDVRLGVASVSTPGATFIIYTTPRDIAALRLTTGSGAGGTTPLTRQKQTITATAGQNIVNLGVSYTVGSNSLDVFVNGKEQTITLDYTESGPSQVTFTYSLSAGDEVDVIVFGTVPTGPVAIHGATHLQSGTDPIPYPVNYVTASGSVTLTSANVYTVLNKTVPDTTRVTLPSTPTIGWAETIKDGKGDAALRPITVLPAAGTIDGNTNFIINTNYGSITTIYNSTEWSII